MKRLEELGVSPAPWNVFDDYDVRRSDTGLVADCGLPGDARLIAAAPDLYEALRLVIETIDALGFKPVVERDPLALAVKCGEKALEKAGGAG